MRSAGIQIGEVHIGCLKSNKEEIKDRNPPRSGKKQAGKG